MRGSASAHTGRRASANALQREIAVLVAPKRRGPVRLGHAVISFEAMRRLFLLRHAKSSWKDRELADHDRPLAPGGRAGDEADRRASAAAVGRARSRTLLIGAANARNTRADLPGGWRGGIRPHRARALRGFRAEHARALARA